MKYLLILFLGISTGLFGQVQNSFPYKNADLSKIIHNQDTFYIGQIDGDKAYKIKFESVVKNPLAPEKYIIIGVTDVEGIITNFKGEIIFKEKFAVKNNPDTVLLFGDFNFSEVSSRHNTDFFKGKIRVQTGSDISKSDGLSNVTFKGELKRAEDKTHQIWFGNFYHNDIDKVIFR
ncbi:hypothetical protein Q73A0000_04290 [Kaistella flava (ex Peng et al. 2021)]|uniref:Lipid/polyisoprenoid-binding YceI-like domain-containing protein n=1 Tax=Kaistella flava (ex Peng et al. 2021) TaxID=2038776 RepID=A0A7M2Y747_9FLAO|nr:hypothetical protein [Kaistella flava (ex Peng et al. 2021)]QOW09639.1 hypothetical protein Q73A0000_04290 [Kaistella flava (ex Peng et al. 2021)]